MIKNEGWEKVLDEIKKAERRKRLFKIILLSFLLAFYVFSFMMMTGCVQKQYVKKDLSQLELDKAECEFEKSKATGYDYIDAALNKGRIFRACMKAKGY